ncbi:hypothetical protein Micbo1qcDRAFT_166384, partial [Microdochium bolleyi]
MPPRLLATFWEILPRGWRFCRDRERSLHIADRSAKDRRCVDHPKTGAWLPHARVWLCLRGRRGTSVDRARSRRPDTVPFHPLFFIFQVIHGEDLCDTGRCSVTISKVPVCLHGGGDLHVLETGDACDFAWLLCPLAVWSRGGETDSYEM